MFHDSIKRANKDGTRPRTDVDCVVRTVQCNQHTGGAASSASILLVRWQEWRPMSTGTNKWSCCQTATQIAIVVRTRVETQDAHPEVLVESRRLLRWTVEWQHWSLGLCIVSSDKYGTDTFRGRRYEPMHSTRQPKWKRKRHEIDPLHIRAEMRHPHLLVAWVMRQECLWAFCAGPSNHPEGTDDRTSERVENAHVSTRQPPQGLPAANGTAPLGRLFWSLKCLKTHFLKLNWLLAQAREKMDHWFWPIVLFHHLLFEEGNKAKTRRQCQEDVQR